MVDDSPWSFKFSEMHGPGNLQFFTQELETSTSSAVLPMSQQKTEVRVLLDLFIHYYTDSYPEKYI